MSYDFIIKRPNASLIFPTARLSGVLLPIKAAKIKALMKLASEHALASGVWLYEGLMSPNTE
jgi:hypothetical protein